MICDCSCSHSYFFLKVGNTYKERDTHTDPVSISISISSKTASMGVEDDVESTAFHPRVDSLIAYQKRERLQNKTMDSSRSASWDEIVATSTVALLTDRLILLKNLLQIIQQDDKSTNTIEFSQNMIHICSKDSVAIQEVNLIPNKMGRYHPPEQDIACTLHCGSLVKFLKLYSTTNVVVCISKPKKYNHLQVRVFENDTFASDITINLTSEDNPEYIDDSKWDSKPHIMVSIENFSNTIKYQRGHTSSDITGYAKHMQIVSQHNVTMVSSTKVYGAEPSPVTITNPTVMQHWENLVEKYLIKTRYDSVERPTFTGVVLNHPITLCHANNKLMALLSKIKTLTRADKQMLECYYHPELPMKFELVIKDGGVGVGSYKIYLLGTSVHPDSMSPSDAAGDVDYPNHKSC